MERKPKIITAVSSNFMTNPTPNPDRVRVDFRDIYLFSYPQDKFPFQAKTKSTFIDKVLLDNIWSSYHQSLKAPNYNKNFSYFMNCMNALSYYLEDLQNKTKDKFSFYVVFKGHQQGVFHTWPEVAKSIQNYDGSAVWKGFHSLSEALDIAQKHFGHTYYIAPSLRTNPNLTSVVHDTPSKILFCDHCMVMEKTVRNLNLELESIRKYNQNLLEDNESLHQIVNVMKEKHAESTAPVTSSKGKEKVEEKCETFIHKEYINENLLKSYVEELFYKTFDTKYGSENSMEKKDVDTIIKKEGDD